MWLLLLSAAFAAGVAWSLVRAVRQARHFESVEAGLPAVLAEFPTVAVIVPVRNEARNIEACLRGLAAQDYPPDRLDILVVDDGSTDGTVDVVGRVMAADPRVRLIRSAALPPRWAGKPFACWRGALAAAADWLCFVDADTTAERHLLRIAVAAARHRGLDLLSLAPFQKLTGFLDRLVIPLGLLAVAVSRDIGRTNRPDTPDASINGQFILVRAACYFAEGGHFAVRRAICEDSALAGRLKHAGFRIAILGGERLIQTRMYASAAALWEGFSKNAVETFGGPLRSLGVAAGALAAGAATVGLPVWAGLAVADDPSLPASGALALAGLAALAVLATSVALCRHFEVPAGYALLFPVAAGLGAAIAVNAVLWRGRGRVAWKGRVYSAAPGLPRPGGS